jgi:hypothetical protein
VMGLVETWVLAAHGVAYRCGITELTQHTGGQLWAKPGLAQVDPGGGMVAKGHAHRGFQRGDLLV